jgi:cyclophilin family peptidyl-prolyl cis-trans isomerase
MPWNIPIRFFNSSLPAACFALACLLLLLPTSHAQTLVRVDSNLGEFDLSLLDATAPKTVANFLGYARRGNFTNSIIHRSVPGFVIQGGGYRLNGNSLDDIPADPPVVNEPGRSNLRGTVAMAKLGGDPNSATKEWFINLADNSANLDKQNGGFTVFGEVIGNGMKVADSIAALRFYDARQHLGGAFQQLPLRNPSLAPDNLVLFRTVRVLPTGARQFSFDYSLGTHGFTAGFADLPTNYDPKLYGLNSGHGKRPAELGGQPALFLSGTNRSDDLWMSWRKKLTGLAPGSLYEASFDLELASSAPTGAAGIGGAPGESVFLKAGASAAEPRPVADKDGWLRLSVDKGNQSQPGSAASVLGHAAKPDDGTAKFALLQRDNRSGKLRVRTAADGSLWVFFGSDSGFEGATTLHFTKFTAVLEPVGRNQTISFPQPASVKFGTTVPLNATATSGLKVSFASANASLAKITAGRLQPTGTGTVRITASQSGDATWNAAPPVTRTVQIMKGDQKIVFTNPGNKTFVAGGTFGLSATVNSKLPLTFTSSNSTVISIQGHSATFRGRGQATLTATQSGDKNWNPAPPVKWTVRVR